MHPLIPTLIRTRLRSGRKHLKDALVAEHATHPLHPRGLRHENLLQHMLCRVMTIHPRPTSTTRSLLRLPYRARRFPLHLLGLSTIMRPQTGKLAASREAGKCHSNLIRRTSKIPADVTTEREGPVTRRMFLRRSHLKGRRCIVQCCTAVSLSSPPIGSLMCGSPAAKGDVRQGHPCDTPGVILPNADQFLRLIYARSHESLTD